MTDARDLAVARDITINGLPVMTAPGGAMAELDRYYEECVIGGLGAFVMVAHGWEDFGDTLRRKLIMEISGLSPEPRVVPAQYQPIDCLDRREDVPLAVQSLTSRPACGSSSWPRRPAAQRAKRWVMARRRAPASGAGSGQRWISASQASARMRPASPGRRSVGKSASTAQKKRSHHSR